MMDRNFTTEDSLGRKIQFHSLDILEYSEFLLALGKEAAGNDEYKQLAQFSYGLDAIDGTPANTPTNLAGIRANIRKLGNEGYNAIMQHFVALATESEPASPAEQNEQIKN